MKYLPSLFKIIFYPQDKEEEKKVVEPPSRDPFDDDFPGFGAADDKKCATDFKEKSPNFEEKEKYISGEKNSKSNKNNDTQRQG